MCCTFLSMWLLAVMQGARVKKGQTLAYVEQLGTFVAVEVSTSLAEGNVRTQLDLGSLWSIALKAAGSDLAGPSCSGMCSHSYVVGS